MAGRNLTDAQREAADRARRETVEQLHEQLAHEIANLDDKDAWRRWLSMASKLHRYSFNNVVLTMLQKPDATMIAGYRAWQAMGHQVRRGEKAIKILGPVTRKVELVDRHTGEPIRDSDGRTQYVRQLVGVRPVSVFDASQVDPPVQTPPEPTLLRGQAPPRLWDLLAELVEAEGFQLIRGDCGGANGLTDYLGREVRVRADVDDAQAVKTLAHELAHVLIRPEPGEPYAGACRGRRVTEALSVQRKERLEQERRLAGLAVEILAAIAERDEAVHIAEQQAADAVRALLAEHLGIAEIADLCGGQLNIKELARLSRIPRVPAAVSGVKS